MKTIPVTKEMHMVTEVSRGRTREMEDSRIPKHFWLVSIQENISDDTLRYYQIWKKVLLKWRHKYTDRESHCFPRKWN